MSASELPAGLVEQMVAFVHKCAGRYDHKATDKHQSVNDLVNDAISLVALLPEPVDPDLIEARTMESDASEANGFIDYALEVRRGEHDDDGPVRCRYEGIIRGRLLESRRKVGL